MAWKLLVLASALTALACGYQTQGTSTVSPRPPRQNATNVTKLYIDTCAKCHGDRGQGGGAGTQSLLTVEKFSQDKDRPFFDAIKKGVPDAGMEAYGQTLTDQEVWALVVHIRELQNAVIKGLTAPKETNGVYRSMHVNYKIEDVVPSGQGLQVPWAVDWLPDGRMLVTNRPGSMIIVKDREVIGTVEGLPAIKAIGQGGLMDVAVHPDYAQNGWIYLSFSEEAGPGKYFTKVVRGKLDESDRKAVWSNQETIFEGPKQYFGGAGHHFGSRIAFDGKGYVYFAIGERGTNMRVQDASTPYGKIMRLHDDGKLPEDNPWKGTAEAFEPTWSTGHRNPQGLCFDLDGQLWDTEHAPRGGDEVNHIVKGANYGWPVVSFGINYNDSPFVLPWPTADQNFKMPVYRWLPSTGACGLDVGKGGLFPQWKGDLLAGGLSGNNVDRLRIKDDKLIEREVLVLGKGRVRDVATAPDGSVYVVLNEPDKIVRLVPVKP